MVQKQDGSSKGCISKYFEALFCTFRVLPQPTKRPTSPNETANLTLAPAIQGSKVSISQNVSLSSSVNRKQSSKKGSRDVVSLVQRVVLYSPILMHDAQTASILNWYMMQRFEPYCDACTKMSFTVPKIAWYTALNHAWCLMHIIELWVHTIEP